MAVHSEYVSSFDRAFFADLVELANGTVGEPRSLDGVEQLNLVRRQPEDLREQTDLIAAKLFIKVDM